MKSGAFKKYGTKTLVYAFLIIVSFIAVFPLYWCLISAFNNTSQILGGRMIPSTHLLENLKNLFEQQDVWRALWYSFRNAVVQVVLSMFVCSIAGYGFEVYHDKGKDFVMKILMMAMMVPFVAILVPMFQMVSKFGLLNSMWGFVIPGISTPFLIMFFRNSARSFPRDIIVAARVDGLNEFSIFIRIFIPTMRPTYAAAATITFMNAWNAYLWPKVVMQDAAYNTMPMLVSNLMSGYVVDYGMAMTGIAICSLPTVIIEELLEEMQR